MNTVIGLFDDAGDARDAAQKLVDAGFRREDIDVTASGPAAGDAGGTDRRGDSDEGFGDKVGNFFSNLFGDDDAENYTEAVRRGSTLVTVHAQSRETADRAAAILDDCGAIDVDGKVAQSRGGEHYQDTSRDTGRDTSRDAGSREVAIPVVEEDLQIGKREVERGGVRVRSRVIEKPVEESIRLREERVHVERRAVDRPATEADFNSAHGGSFEVTERSEQAVVNKEARVVEEITINKEVGERTETVRDTVRRTDVDVEEIKDDEAGRGKGKGSGR